MEARYPLCCSVAFRGVPRSTRRRPRTAVDTSTEGLQGSSQRRTSRRWRPMAAAVTLSSVLCLSRTQLHYAAVSTPRPSGERFSLLHAAASRSVQRSRLSRPATEGRSEGTVPTLLFRGVSRLAAVSTPATEDYLNRGSARVLAAAPPTGDGEGWPPQSPSAIAAVAQARRAAVSRSRGHALACRCFFSHVPSLCILGLARSG